MAQASLQRKMAEAKEKEREAKRLQMELERARHDMEVNQRALQEALNASKVLHVTEHDDEDESSENLHCLCGCFIRLHTQLNVC